MSKNRTIWNNRRPPEKKNAEMKFYGFHACLALWKARPDDVIRVYVEQKNVQDVSSLLKWCASKSKAYHIVSSEEMGKIADSVHHEGLCILAKELPQMSFASLLEELQLKRDPICLLYLDGVQNPHNIGSIMRVCAHFGVKYILGLKDVLPKVSPSAYRVAQGGAECVRIISLDDVELSFSKLKKCGIHFLGTSSHGGKSLYQCRFAPRTMVIMGAESDGMGRKLVGKLDATLEIPGTGMVESLNVSVATGLILGEYWRQNEGTKNER